MESFTPEFREYFSHLQPVLPEFNRILSQVQNAKTAQVAVQLLKEYGQLLQSSPTDIHVRIGKELTEKLATEEERLKAFQRPKSEATESERIKEVFTEKKKEPTKEEPSVHISALPTLVTGTIASHLSIQEQEALATATAKSTETKNITKGIAEAQRSFLRSVYNSATQEAKDGFYSLTGRQFPSPDAINRMSAQEIKGTLKALENTMKRVWKGLPEWVRHLYPSISTTIDFQNPSTLLEIFAASRAFNLVAVGRALGAEQSYSITSKEALLEVGQTVAKRLNEDNPPITKIRVGPRGMTAIPPEVLKLKNLITLDLSFNHIGFVPKEIGNLTWLSVLNLFDNQISALPEEIGKLTELTSLGLGKRMYATELTDMLTALPAGLGKLERLDFLDLSYNNIKDWPLQLDNLKNLQSLIIYNNPLSVPANVLNNMPRLKVLEASIAQVKDWPAAEGKRNGQEFRMERNDMNVPALRVILSGP